MQNHMLKNCPAGLPLTLGLAATLVLAGCGGGDTGGAPPAETETIKVEIRRTGFGVPHIVGKDLRSAAYGLAYAYAQDNICIAADRLLTVAGERSKYLGGSAMVAAGSSLSNLRSDFYYRNILDQAAVDKAFAAAGQPAKDAIAGYVAGYNRFLLDAKPTDFGDCAGAAWAKRPVSEMDLKRHLLALATNSGAGAFIAAIADAQPPAPALASAGTLRPPQLARIGRSAQQLARLMDANPLGSNGQAFGSEASEGGRGVLFGNPHFPWSGTLRFYQSHVKVPGQYDVMGAGLGLVPLPQIGFNADLAWTHTVSTGRRFTLFELTLKDGAYLVDGVARPLSKKEVTVEVLENGVLTPQTRSFYASHHGPLLVSSALGASWTPTKAYALRDANLDNGRVVDQVWDLGRASTVEQLRDISARRMGAPWVNTIAADRAGKAFYGDLSVVPNVNAALSAKCANSPQAQALAAARTYLLDGSRAECDWPVDAAAASPGIMAAAALPTLLRTDYVSNSNESAWLANPAQLSTGFSPLVGDQARTQSLRTRMAFTQILERLAGSDGQAGNKVSPDKLEFSFFQNRMMSAELLMPGLLTLCNTPAAAAAVASNGSTINLGPACAVLAGWDRRAKRSSVGTPLFREFWRRAQAIPNLYETPFDAAKPITTPSNPAISKPAVATAMLKALADGVLALNAAGVPLSEPLGSVQYVTRGGQRIPIEGGDEFEGVFNKMTPPGLGAGGYTSMLSGSSYIQIVGFDADGPQARGLLTYSQSTNPASPYYADQTQQFSNAALVKLPYRESEIAADPKLTAPLLLIEK
ncbi:penicillin acylase family protein [Paucibacter soli]|uniref:penicillin acylase family protein n=1 Tax=Paucibacter soli TaxID=3133433 RepID=UPI003099AC1F